MANNETEFASDNSFRNAIKSFEFINEVPITDNQDFYFEEIDDPKKIQVINIAFNALKNQVGNNQRWISILEKEAHNTVLVHLIRKVINEEKTFKKAAEYLSPLTLRILKMNKNMQDIVFEGNAQMVYDHYGHPLENTLIMTMIIT